MNTFEHHSFLIKQEAVRLGFDYCNMAEAVKLDEDARRLESWLNKGFPWFHALHGKLF